MVTVTKSNVAELLLADSLADVHRLRQKVAVFERKYGASLDVFEKRIQAQDESFECFDDLMEWKACRRALTETESRVDNLKHGNVEVA